MWRSVPHRVTTGQGTDDHHAEDHASRHRSGGADELFKTARVATGDVASGAQAVVTVAWPSAFPDTNYTPQVTIEETNGDLVVEAITAVAAGSIDVEVRNRNGLNSRSGTLHAIAVAD